MSRPDELLPVTEADRKLYSALYLWMNEEKRLAMEGEFDDRPAMQTITRHRMEGERLQSPSAASQDGAGMREALAMAIKHIEHMAAWIGKKNSGERALATYSFESLSEDMPGIKAALNQQEPQGSIEAERLPERVGEATLAGVEAKTRELMAKASEREGLSISDWVALRMREAAERALSTPPSDNGQGLREALVRVRDVLRNVREQWDGDPKDAIDVGEAIAELDAALSTSASLSMGDDEPAL